MLTIGLTITNTTPSALDGDHGIGFYSYGTTADGISYVQSSVDKVDYQLYDSGCLIGGVKNCTAVCSDTRLIWSHAAGSNPLTNFANSLAYPAIANLLSDGNLVSPMFSDTTQQFGITALPQESVDKINASTRACFTTYCTGNIRCSEAQSGHFLYKIPADLPSGVPQTVRYPSFLFHGS